MKAEERKVKRKSIDNDVYRMERTMVESRQERNMRNLFKHNSVVMKFKLDKLTGDIDDVKFEMGLLMNKGTMTKTDKADLSKLKKKWAVLKEQKESLCNNWELSAREETERWEQLTVENKSVYTTPLPSSLKKVEGDSVSVLTDPIPKKICLDKEGS